MANLAWAIFNFIMTGFFMVMMIIGVNSAVKSRNNHQTVYGEVAVASYVFCIGCRKCMAYVCTDGKIFQCYFLMENGKGIFYD